MTIYKIRIAPDPALREVAEPVPAVTDEIRTLLDDMLETMYDAPGIGLAATQIAVPKRLIVMDVSNGQKGESPSPLKLINPEIIETSEETATQEEGCLSLPGQFADVTRPKHVKVKYTDEDGEEHVIEGDGILAACLQHEIDHLDGKLFIDYLSSLKKNLIMNALRKEMRRRSRQKER